MNLTQESREDLAAEAPTAVAEAYEVSAGIKVLNPAQESREDLAAEAPTAVAEAHEVSAGLLSRAFRQPAPRALSLHNLLDLQPISEDAEGDHGPGLGSAAAAEAGPAEGAPAEAAARQGESGASGSGPGLGISGGDGGGGTVYGSAGVGGTRDGTDGEGGCGRGGPCWAEQRVLHGSQESMHHSPRLCQLGLGAPPASCTLAPGRWQGLFLCNPSHACWMLPRLLGHGRMQAFRACVAQKQTCELVRVPGTCLHLPVFFNH